MINNDTNWDEDFWNEEPDDWQESQPIEARELFEKTDEEEYSIEGDEDFDDVILDIDYSEMRGDFKQSFGKIKHTVKNARPKKRKPLNKTFHVKDKGRANIGGGKKQIQKIIVPNGREVIVQGDVSDFILSNDHDALKNIGYYKGKKLKEMVLSIENTSGQDFDLELFNPSMPLDYLQSSSLNLNDRIVIAGGTRVTYSDLLFNLLANPTLIPNARFVCTGPSVREQKTEKLTFVNKAMDGEATVKPLQIALNYDLYQQQNDVIQFDIMGQLNRAFIPDGMDIMQYRVLAGNTVTFCFYYKQKSLKKLLFKEARKVKMVLGEPKGIL